MTSTATRGTEDNAEHRPQVLKQTGEQEKPGSDTLSRPAELGRGYLAKIFLTELAANCLHCVPFPRWFRMANFTSEYPKMNHAWLGDRSNKESETTNEVA